MAADKLLYTVLFIWLCMVLSICFIRCIIRFYTVHYSFIRCFIRLYTALYMLYMAPACYIFIYSYIPIFLYSYIPRFLDLYIFLHPCILILIFILFTYSVCKIWYGCFKVHSIPVMFIIFHCCFQGLIYIIYGKCCCLIGGHSINKSSSKCACK